MGGKGDKISLLLQYLIDLSPTVAWDDSGPCLPQSSWTPFHYGVFSFFQSTLLLPSLWGKLFFLDNYYLKFWGLGSGKDNSLTSWVNTVTLQCGHFVYQLGITWLHAGNGPTLAGKDQRFMNTVFSRVDVVGAVVDSKLEGIGDCQILVSLRGLWYRLRTCIIPVMILGSTNSKPDVPLLTWIVRTMKISMKSYWVHLIWAFFL